MFAVIEFKEDGGLALVKSAWISPRKKDVFWPPTKDPNQYTKLVRSTEDSITEAWKLYEISRIFYQSGEIIHFYQVCHMLTCVLHYR